MEALSGKLKAKLDFFAHKTSANEGKLHAPQKYRSVATKRKKEKKKEKRDDLAGGRTQNLLITSELFNLFVLH
jgi:hypothetical protein